MWIRAFLKLPGVMAKADLVAMYAKAAVSLPFCILLYVWGGENPCLFFVLFVCPPLWIIADLLVWKYRGHLWNLPKADDKTLEKKFTLSKEGLLEYAKRVPLARLERAGFALFIALLCGWSDGIIQVWGFFGIFFFILAPFDFVFAKLSGIPWPKDPNNPWRPYHPTHFYKAHELPSDQGLKRWNRYYNPTRPGSMTYAALEIWRRHAPLQPPPRSKIE